MAPKIVVITGCSSGIGLETAVLLAKDKESRFKVFATMRNLDKREKLKKDAGDALDKTLFIRKLDVSKEDSISDFIAGINRDEGGVDILINNAGIGQTSLLDRITREQMRLVFETNVFGLMQLTQSVVAGMKTKRSGHIINIGSVTGRVPMPLPTDIYTASKFAVEGFSESIAPYLRQFNISVSVIEPGAVATEFSNNVKSSNLGSFGAIDTEADEQTQEIQKQAFQAVVKNIAVNVQTAKDIANVVLQVIEAEKPHLHYTTSESTTASVAAKYIDPTGDSDVKAACESAGWKY